MPDSGKLYNIHLSSNRKNFPHFINIMEKKENRFRQTATIENAASLRTDQESSGNDRSRIYMDQGFGSRNHPKGQGDFEPFRLILGEEDEEPKVLQAVPKTIDQNGNVTSSDYKEVDILSSRMEIATKAYEYTIDNDGDGTPDVIINSPNKYEQGK